MGDFNLTLDQNKDTYNYRHINNPQARKIVVDIMKNINLSDPFRELNPDIKRYTWRKKNPIKQARLDFFLISDTLISNVRSCKILSSYRSDHSMITIKIELNEFKRGKGLWKLNNSLLHDQNYIELVKKTLLETKKQYALPIYNLDKICDIPNDQIQFIISDQLFLEILLTEIRGKTISYSSYKKKESDKLENKLIKDIDKLESILDATNIDNLDQLKTQLENIRNEKMKGVIIRSKAQWSEEGEIPSKYFLTLENKNFTSKLMYQLQKDNGEIITNQDKILEEVQLFYTNLFTNIDAKQQDNSSLDETFKSIKINKVTEKDNLKIQGEITNSEALYVLKKMKNNKSPGSDGYTVEFFKIFWAEIGDFTIRSINEGYKTTNMSITQRQGIITCIPKGDKQKQYLKNWRPITLLNITYKIASGCIAQRIKSVLDYIINEDQTGFLSGRFIGENIRTVYDIMNYTEHYNIPGMIFLIDFEKAFDSISWNFIFKVLRFFNFNNSIIQWVKTFTNDIFSTVNMGGNLSQPIKISRGCRQGDPVSSYLFLLCVEILSLKLKNIKGMKIKDTEYILSQFADDTTIFLDGSKKSLKTTLEELTWFGKLSGLNINLTKSHVIWIGSKAFSQDKYLICERLSWNKTKFELLGIQFDINIENMINVNFSKKYKDIEQTIRKWKQRFITPIGKITIIKSLLLPKLVHLFQSLPHPSEQFYTHLNTLLYNFIWDGPIDRIKREILIKQYSEGGLKMIHVKKFASAIKLTWVRRILTDKKWKNIILTETNTTVKQITLYGNNFLHDMVKKTKNMFWKDVFLAFILLNQQCHIHNLIDFTKYPIWHSDIIKIDNKPFVFKKWIEKNIYTVKDLTKTENNTLKPLTYIELQEKYDFKPNFLEYLGIINNIKQLHTNFNVNKLINRMIIGPVIPYNLAIIISNAKGTKTIYNTLIKDKMNIPNNQSKWEEQLSRNDLEWTKIYDLPFQLSMNPNLKWLQYRINHRILATNQYLKKINITNNNLCDLCHTEIETLTHLFWNCSKTVTLISEIEHWINTSLNLNIIFTESDIILGITYKTEYNEILNLIILTIKKYIYYTKYKKKTLSVIIAKAAIKNLIKSGLSQNRPPKNIEIFERLIQ